LRVRHRSAAALHGLTFVPLCFGAYFLAMRATLVTRPAVQALGKALQNRWFGALLRDLPGYALPAQGEPTSIAEAFEQLRT
jgi:molybdate-binding protein